MKYVNKERLVELRNKLPESLVKSFVELLIIECEELPQEQWQTIEEFYGNSLSGICFANHKSMGVIGCYYNLSTFYHNGQLLNHEFITHVMPIKTPDAPK